MTLRYQRPGSTNTRDNKASLAPEIISGFVPVKPKPWIMPSPSVGLSARLTIFNGTTMSQSGSTSLFVRPLERGFNENGGPDGRQLPLLIYTRIERFRSSILVLQLPDNKRRLLIEGTVFSDSLVVTRQSENTAKLWLRLNVVLILRSCHLP